MVRPPGGVKANDTRGQQGVIRNAISRVNNRNAGLQNGAVPGAHTGTVMPNFGSRAPQFQETDEEKLEREASLLLAAASGAIKGTSGALKVTSGALKGTSGALKNSNQRRPAAKVAQDGGLRAVHEDGEVGLIPGATLASVGRLDRNMAGRFFDCEQLLPCVVQSACKSIACSTCIRP